MSDFNECFRELTGYDPFHWQKQLYSKFMNGELPDACDIPTGLGKTNVMAVWLIALAHQISRQDRRMPLRLVYVVDRRVIVDQATSEAEKLIDTLAKSQAKNMGCVKAIAEQLGRSTLSDQNSLIALSSLRGQKADNREWCLDPSRPAIIIGTVDMIGSRLLFSGYGKVGINHRSLQAGLLGQDSLVVIDEAHLSPCFVKTQLGVQKYVKAYPEIRPFHIMTLSATLSTVGNTLVLDESEECRHTEAERRLKASKSLEWIKVNSNSDSHTENTPTAKSITTELVEKIVTAAIRYENTNPDDDEKSVIIFASTVDLVNSITRELKEAIIKQQKARPENIAQNVEEITNNRILKLTGEMRAHERDQLVETEKFKRFLPGRIRNHKGQTSYLVATSCAEVGVNIDADHGICDLTTLDSMIQRIGRINRFGFCNSTVSVLIDESALHLAESDYHKDLEHQQTIQQMESEIVALEAEAKSGNSSKDLLKQLKKSITDKKRGLKNLKNSGPVYDHPKLERAKSKVFHTWKALKSLSDSNGKIDVSPLSLRGLINHHPETIPDEPVLPPLETARIDDWSMTSLKQSEYPRPLVHYWLRGVIDDEQAETTFVWRQELCDVQRFPDSGEGSLVEISTMVHPQPQERATLSSTRAEKIIREIAKRAPEQFVVLIDQGGNYLRFQLKDFNDKKYKIDVFSLIAFRTVLLPSTAGGLDVDGNPDLKGLTSSDVLKQDEWGRHFINRNEDGQYSVKPLGGNENPEHFSDLGHMLKYLSNDGILINRKSLQELFTRD